MVIGVRTLNALLQDRLHRPDARERSRGAWEHWTSAEGCVSPESKGARAIF
jgi:hypothetical protein